MATKDRGDGPGSTASLQELPIAGAKVLCVDDEEDTLDAMALMLRERGAEVRTARAVDEAFTILASFGADVVVSDLAMPHKDGFDLIRQLRMLAPPLSKTPAVATSAYACGQNLERVTGMGFNRFVSKPLDPDVLASVVSELVRSEPHTVADAR